MSELKIKKWDASKLIDAEYNPRQISEKQFDDLKNSIKRFGLVDPILVNTNKDRYGIIIGGHMRTKAAVALGINIIPVVELDLTLEKEKELNVRLNKNTGSWNHDDLANYFDIEDLSDWGWSNDDLKFAFGDIESDIEEESEKEHKQMFSVIAELESEKEQEALFNKLQKDGYKCKVSKS